MKEGKFTVFWSKDDNQFVGIHSDWVYLSGFGDTEEEALKDIKEAVEFSEEWLQEEKK